MNRDIDGVGRHARPIERQVEQDPGGHPVHHLGVLGHEREEALLRPRRVHEAAGVGLGDRGQLERAEADRAEESVREGEAEQAELLDGSQVVGLVD